MFSAFTVFSIFLVLVANSTSKLPNKLSELNGYAGIVVEVEKVDQQSSYCHVKFPDNFGSIKSNANERALLEAISSGRLKINLDMSCFHSVQVDALDQMYFLAVSKNELWAAKRLVLGMGLGVDGEVAEEYEGSYILPLIETSHNPKAVIDQSKIGDLAINLCGWAKPRGEIRRLVRLSRHLKTKGLADFAKLLDKCE
jgi:hypothetical protein